MDLRGGKKQRRGQWDRKCHELDRQVQEVPEKTPGAVCPKVRTSGGALAREWAVGRDWDPASGVLGAGISSGCPGAPLSGLGLLL